MSNPRLPDLPEEEILGTERCGHVLEARGYTAEQMHQYGLACYLAGMERAAGICEGHIVETMLRGGERRLAPHFNADESLHDGQAYATAIRAASKGKE